MEVFFQERGAPGKEHAERVAKAGGGSHQSAPCTVIDGDSRVAFRPPEPSTPANHRPPAISFLKKDPHGQPLCHFQRAKVLQFSLLERYRHRSYRTLNPTRPKEPE